MSRPTCLANSLASALSRPVRVRACTSSIPRASTGSAVKSMSSSSSSTIASRKPALNVPSTAGGPQSADEYCASLVRRLDPEAWLCSYFWPRRERAWWLAYRAFNLELHLVSTTVSQPAIAAMRFQFWRDALNAVFASDKGAKPTVPLHPVALALADVRAHRPVQKYYLGQMIDVRAKTLSLPPSSATLEAHLSTYSPISSALLLGPLPLVLPPTDPETGHIAHTLSHLAHLLTTVSTLRSLPSLVSKRQLNLPADIAAKHGVVDEEVFRRGAEASGLKDALWEIGTRGMDELITARRDLNKTDGKVLPSSAMPLFLSAVPAESYLKRLEKLDFDVFHPDLAKHDWRLAPRIWWRFQSGKL